MNNSRITAAQTAVGNCPICNKAPGWFNNVPLRAYCWGQPGAEHNEARRIVPSPYQPYGEYNRTRWVISKVPNF